MARRIVPVLLVLFLLAVGIAVLVGVPAGASRRYGPPSSRLGPVERLEYAARLLWYGNQLTRPLDRDGPEQTFVIEPGESVPSVAVRLDEAGLIRSAAAFRDYLVYTGLDTSIQSGSYQLSPAASSVDIARALQDATPGMVTFVILPGWRTEEVAASLPTSGLGISPEAFQAAARATPAEMGFLPDSVPAEGFLYPDSYLLPRETTAEALVEEVLRNFSLHLTGDIREGYSRQGLDTYQGVTLASIVQREAVQAEEQPLIASVFLNRLRQGMKLDSDPTVQYALGYDPQRATWWTNPLSSEDLQVDSPYNTYLYAGLPPTPIASPSLSALRAVALPAQTPYLYFRARCDGSGLHTFAITFEEHLNNACP